MYTYPKNFLSVTQLIQKLKDTGMTIDSNDTAEIALTTIGYYRLKGYSFHLIDPSVFKDKKTFWKNQSTIASEISRSNDVFIEHNFDNHDGAIPIWAAVEVMSFGTISKTIKNMKTGSNTAFSELIKNYKFKNSNGRDVNPSKDMFTSWIQAVSIMRNICAHNSRIYNRSISTRPQLIYSDVINPHPRYNGLYQIMLSMKCLRPTEDSWTAFITDFKQLLNNYSDVCDIRRLNFPSDWESHF